MYIPESIMEEFKEKFLAEVSKIKVGDVEDFSNFMGAVISKKAFESITGYIDYARDSEEAEILAGGQYDDSEDRKSTRLNSSHVAISYAVFCLKKKSR